MQELSDAVVHWIAYRRCLNIDRFIVESLLREPIVGYLQANGWKSELETDYHQTCAHVEKGKCFSDYLFSFKKRKVLIETKYFKTSSQNTVFNDFVKLALPLSQGWSVTH